MTHPGSPFWVSSAALQLHLNRSATGDPSTDWLSLVRFRHLPAEVSSLLVLGCGEGFLERALLRKGGIQSITATDADSEAVEGARRRAGLLGMASIVYAVADPGAGALPPGPWDAIVAHDVLHHVEDPERALAGIHEALALSGRFVFAEYVGPNRFQYSEERMELVRRYFRLLPERLRRDPASGRILWKRERVDPERLARDHPFEAARSEDLLPLARRIFAAEAELSGAGGLMHFLASGLEGNFGQAPVEEERLLEVFCDAEAHLEREGLAPANFAIFVGRRRAVSPMT